MLLDQNRKHFKWGYNATGKQWPIRITNIHSSRTLEQLASLPVPLVPPCGGPRRAAELSALYRAPNETLARQRHGTYKVGLKVLVLVYITFAALRNVSSRCAKWCYGTLRQMKEGSHAYEDVAFDNFFTVNIRDMD